MTPVSLLADGPAHELGPTAASIGNPEPACDARAQLLARLPATTLPKPWRRCASTRLVRRAALGEPGPPSLPLSVLADRFGVQSRLSPWVQSAGHDTTEAAAELSVDPVGLHAAAHSPGGAPAAFAALASRRGI